MPRLSDSQFIWSDIHSLIYIFCAPGFVPLCTLLLLLPCLAVVGYNFLHRPRFLDKDGAMWHGRLCGYAKTLGVSIGK
jgi:hypothetical protein